MERINGYKVIDDYKQIQKNKGGHNLCFWLSDGKNEHFFKVVSMEAQMKELFYSILLLETADKAVENDLAISQGQYGVLSPNYNPNNIPTIKMRDILEKCKNTKKYFVQNIFSVETINEILTLYTSEIRKEYPTKKTEVLMTFIMQILLANIDCRTENIEWLIEKEIHLSPFHDFEFCGMNNLNSFAFESYYRKYLLTYNTLTTYYDTPEKTLQDFLEYGKKEEIELLKKNLEKMQEVKTKKIIEQCEEKIKRHLSLTRKIKLEMEFTQNLRNVDKIINGEYIAIQNPYVI